MHAKLTMLVVYLLSIVVLTPARAEMPLITGKPVITAPQLLEWPRDKSFGGADLTEPTAKGVDLHGQINKCGDIDLVLSTAGNYHMALREIWDMFVALPGNEKLNAIYTTSPPISYEQILKGGVRVGNLLIACPPSIVAGTTKYLDKLDQAGLIEKQRYPIYESRGMVLLVPKGNPAGIKTVWDLAKPTVHIVTPNPYTGEPLDAYAGAIYAAASADPNPPKRMTPDKLINFLFNEKPCDINDRSCDPKWYAGTRIHHREVPRAVAFGTAKRQRDTFAGTLFYHIARDAVTQFPDLFEIVPIGGTVDDPRPVAGTPLNMHSIAFVKGNWTPAQLEARKQLAEAYLSQEATSIFEKHGMRRPAGYVEMSE